MGKVNSKHLNIRVVVMLAILQILLALIFVTSSRIVASANTNASPIVYSSKNIDTTINTSSSSVDDAAKVSLEIVIMNTSDADISGVKLSVIIDKFGGDSLTKTLNAGNLPAGATQTLRESFNTSIGQYTISKITYSVAGGEFVEMSSYMAAANDAPQSLFASTWFWVVVIAFVLITIIVIVAAIKFPNARMYGHHRHHGYHGHHRGPRHRNGVHISVGFGADVHSHYDHRDDSMFGGSILDDHRGPGERDRHDHNRHHHDDRRGRF